MPSNEVFFFFFMGKLNKLVELFSSASQGQTSPVSCSVYDKRRFPPAVWGQPAMSAWCCAAPVPGHLVSGSVCCLYLFDFIKVGPCYWALCGAQSMCFSYSFDVKAAREWDLMLDVEVFPGAPLLSIGLRFAGVPSVLGCLLNPKWWWWLSLPC